MFGSTHNQPACAKTGGTIRLGQAVKGYAEHIVSQSRHRRVLCAVVQDFVVNLVSIDNQVMFSGKLNNLFEQFRWINGSCRVVRIDDDDTTGFGRNFAPDVLNVRVPVRLFVAQVMNCAAS